MSKDIDQVLCPECDTHILKHEANECLDAWISQLVYGINFKVAVCGSCCTCQACGFSHDECRCGYSTSIEKAWNLVDDINPKLGRMYVDRLEDGHCYVGFPVYGTDAPSLPLAICRTVVFALSLR